MKMKSEIQNFIKVLNFVTSEDLHHLLTQTGNVNKQVLLKNLTELEGTEAIIKILPVENSLALEGYIPGPNIEVKNEVEIQKAIIEGEIEKREFSIIDLNKLCDRLEKSFNDKVEDLKNRICGIYDNPRELELDYFTLTLKYHALRRFFYENFDISPFESLKNSLNECRRLLDNLGIK